MTSAADIRYALRLLGRSPIFTITAVLSLAAGIAGTSAIFSLTDALLLRPRPGVADPGRLIDIGRATNGEGLDNFGYPLFEAMRDGTTTLQGIAAHQLSPNVVSLGDANISERVFASLVSGNYFQVVGTRPAAGRFFLPEEDSTPDTHPVVVLSHEFWLRRFGGRQEIIGESIRLNSRPYTVVGVAEPGFTGTTFVGADLWVPMAMDAHVRARSTSLRNEHRAVWMTAVGRLSAGATLAQARQELDAIMKRYLESRGDDRLARWSVAVAQSARVPAPILAPVSGFIGVLAALTLLVLLIACTNVAGMLLARGLDRRREFATRLAVGASRRRLVVQLLVEGLTLALVAGAASIPLTYFLVGLLASFRPDLPFPVALDLRVDPRVQAFAFALAALASIAFALLPAVQSTRVDVARALHGATATTDRARAWLRQGLVATQVAVALVLLVAAGLFLRSLQEAAHVDIGFNPQGVDTLHIDTSIGGYPDEAEALRAIDTLMERFRLIPGVTHVAASRMVPLQGGGLGLGGLRAPGYTGPDGTDQIGADWDTVTADYFSTVQMPIVSGRTFAPQDRAGAPLVAIVNETLAGRVWPGQDPVGRPLMQRAGPGDERALTVVGVARNGKYRMVSDGPRNFIYVPLAQQFMSDVAFYVRRDPEASRITELRRAVVAFNPLLPVIRTETLEQATTLALLPQRLAAWIAGSVGTIGVFLAALGLYGLMAFSVSQRRREIAIRLAVGAAPRSVLWLVLRRAAVLAGVGAAIGLAIAAGVSAVLRSLLIGLGPADPLAFGGALVLLAVVMLVSAWTPARRASRMDPVTALRAE